MLKKVTVVFEVEAETQNEAEDYVLDCLKDAVDSSAFEYADTFYIVDYYP